MNHQNGPAFAVSLFEIIHENRIFRTAQPIPTLPHNLYFFPTIPHKYGGLAEEYDACVAVLSCVLLKHIQHAVFLNQMP